MILSRRGRSQVIVRFANGKEAIIDVCRQAPYGYDQRAEVTQLTNAHALRVRTCAEGRLESRVAAAPCVRASAPASELTAQLGSPARGAPAQG